MTSEARDVRRLARQVLALALLVGAAALGMLGVLGHIPLAWGVLLALGGVAVAAVLPGGGRPAGWLFAIWCAVALITVGRAAVGDAEDTERVRLALIGGALYLALASVGFWSCGSISPGRRDG